MCFMEWGCTLKNKIKKIKNKKNLGYVHISQLIIVYLIKNFILIKSSQFL